MRSQKSWEDVPPLVSPSALSESHSHSTQPSLAFPAHPEAAPLPHSGTGAASQASMVLQQTCRGRGHSPKGWRGTKDRTHSPGRGL